MIREFSDGRTIINEDRGEQFGVVVSWMHRLLLVWVMLANLFPMDRWSHAIQWVSISARQVEGSENETPTNEDERGEDETHKKWSSHCRARRGRLHNYKVWHQELLQSLDDFPHAAHKQPHEPRRAPILDHLANQRLRC